MTSYYTIEMEYNYYFDVVNYLSNNDINHAESLLFDIYDIDDTIFDDNRRFTKLFLIVFEQENL